MELIKGRGVIFAVLGSHGTHMRARRPTWSHQAQDRLTGSVGPHLHQRLVDEVHVSMAMMAC